MEKITVLKDFKDYKEKVNRTKDDTFEATTERANEIDQALPGFIKREAIVEIAIKEEIKETATKKTTKKKK